VVVVRTQVDLLETGVTRNLDLPSPYLRTSENLVIHHLRLELDAVRGRGFFE